MKCTWYLLLDAPSTIDKSLEVMAGLAACTGGLAKPETSSSRTAGWDAQSDGSCNLASFNSILQNGAPTDAMSSTSDVHGLRDHLDCGA